MSETLKKIGRDKIENMPAGRGIDVLIQRYVFESDVYESHDEYLKAGFPYAAEWDSRVEYPAYWYAPHESACCVPNYSLCWDAMGKVIKKMYDRFGHLDERNGIILMLEKSGWFAEFPYPYWESASAKDGPLAVCRAALLSMVDLNKETFRV